MHLNTHTNEVQCNRFQKDLSPSVTEGLDSKDFSPRRVEEKKLDWIEWNLQCRVNNRAHRTKEMGSEWLVVRRGQPFSLLLQCADTLLLAAHHQLALLIQLGECPGMKTRSASAGVGSIGCSEINSLPGLYLYCLDSIGPVLYVFFRSDLVFFASVCALLSAADCVYLADEQLLQEYVLNENGILYQGSWDQITSLPWNFGQFEKGVVDICFEVLDYSPAALKHPEMDMRKRADPVYVSRTITAMVNANDDRGVVLGRWDGDYGDGVAPTRWTGSIPILRRWSEGGTQRVRYGQCWVFSAVACTILRCLGIPTRCVTNYSSAHDTEGNVSVDFLFNEHLENVSEGRKDMIWNYHCWVESWMRREDLPKGYDGWQVLDPTPQERSDGVYCCGPCPVLAVREGEVGMKYDTTFVFSEVNADLICWMVRPDGERTRVSTNSDTVGRNISTKSAYGDYREDITANYKYPEGSLMEREVYRKAGKRVSRPDGGSGQLVLSIKHTQAVHGTDFDVFVEVHNIGREDTLAQLTVMSSGVTYNSLQRGDFPLLTHCPLAHKEVMRLRYEHYGACVTEHNLIRVTALLQDSGQHVVLREVNIPLKMPRLFVKVIGEAVVSRRLMALISFTNPLPVTLKRGVFTVEGAGLTGAQEIGDIGPGQEVAVKFSFKPIRAGIRKLVVDFDSDILRDVKGEAMIIVRKKSSENA
uniref:protein-glutamine gamma-glutamyltransferase n=1 Tax=Electrophorus electricus TaxID=8005 RepID=A0A4W4G3Y5_ELEEL